VAGLLPEDRPGRIPAIQAYYAAFSTQLHNHHCHEDELIFPALEAKVGRDAMRLDVLDAQHQGLDGAISRLATALQNVGDARTGFADAKAGTERAAEQLQVLLREHLALEEGDALVLYADVMSVPEHLALEQRVQEMGTFDDLCFMIPWLFDSIPAEPREQVLSALPGELRDVYRGHRQQFRALASCLQVNR
jgi:Hemerythrin HHE cation binding domain